MPLGEVMAREVDVRAILIQGFSVLFLCALIWVIAGTTLQGMEEGLALLSGLALITPPLLDLRGNINGALASRLGTALHTGVIEPKLKFTADLKANIVATLILSLLASATIGALASAALVLAGVHVNVVSLMTIAILAGFMSGVILASITVVIAVFTFRHGWDPDNVTAPLMTALGDFLTVVCMFLAVLLVGVG